VKAAEAKLSAQTDFDKGHDRLMILAAIALFRDRRFFLRFFFWR
jgi:hypothetical protein